MLQTGSVRHDLTHASVINDESQKDRPSQVLQLDNVDGLLEVVLVIEATDNGEVSEGEADEYQDKHAAVLSVMHLKAVRTSVWLLTNVDAHISETLEPGYRDDFS